MPLLIPITYECCMILRIFHSLLLNFSHSESLENIWICFPNHYDMRHLRALYTWWQAHFIHAKWSLLHCILWCLKIPYSSSTGIFFQAEAESQLSLINVIWETLSSDTLCFEKWRHYSGHMNVTLQVCKALFNVTLGTANKFNAEIQETFCCKHCSN